MDVSDDVIQKEQPANSCPSSFVDTELSFASNLALAFNANVHRALDVVRQSTCLPDTYDVPTVCRHLNEYRGVSPRALSQFLLKDEKSVQTNFYWYFNSVDIDYLSIEDAIRASFPRIALPDDMVNLTSVFSAFGDAYVHANSFTQFSAADVSKIGLSCVALSMTKSMEATEFSQLLTRVPGASREYGDLLFNAFKSSPVSLSFCSPHFTLQPEPCKSGVLHLKTEKKKSKKFLELMKTTLRVWKDHSRKELDTEIPLLDVKARVVTEAGESRLVISRNNRMAFGLKSRSAKKKTKDVTYDFVSNDVNVLCAWAANINFVTMRLIIQQIAFA